MASALEESAAASPASCGNSLGELLESHSNHQPHTIELPGNVTVMKNCGDGMVIGLSTGKVLLVSVAPEPISYCLESDNLHKGVVSKLAVSRNGEICLSGDDANYDHTVKMWSLVERKELATLCRTCENVDILAITNNGRLGIIVG